MTLPSATNTEQSSSLTQKKKNTHIFFLVPLYTGSDHDNNVNGNMEDYL